MMTCDRPDVLAASRYTMGQASRLLGINRTTLWRWIAKGRIRPSYDKETMRPYISGKAILDLWYRVI